MEESPAQYLIVEHRSSTGAECGEVTFHSCSHASSLGHHSGLSMMRLPRAAARRSISPSDSSLLLSPVPPGRVILGNPAVKGSIAGGPCDARFFFHTGTSAPSCALLTSLQTRTYFSTRPLLMGCAAAPWGSSTSQTAAALWIVFPLPFCAATTFSAVEVPPPGRRLSLVKTTTGPLPAARSSSFCGRTGGGVGLRWTRCQWSTAPALRRREGARHLDPPVHGVLQLLPRLLRGLLSERSP